jgi:hypothetical protein
MFTRILKTTAAGVIALGLGVSPSNAGGDNLCGVDIENATPSGTVTGSLKTIGWLVSAR